MFAVARESMTGESDRGLGRHWVFGGLKDRRVIIQSRRGEPETTFARFKMLLTVIKKMGRNSCLLNTMLYIFLLPGGITPQKNAWEKNGHLWSL